jgi:hypothetical protein
MINPEIYGSDFEPGDIVEFCGEEGVVVRNYGHDGKVRQGSDIMTWKWIFEGIKVKLVRKAQ